MTDSLGDYEAVRALALQLRGMRSGIEDYRTGHRSTDPETPERLAALLDRYDVTLVRLAVLLGVEVSVSLQDPGSSRLNDEVRSLLEHSVRVFGIDIEPPGP